MKFVIFENPRWRMAAILKIINSQWQLTADLLGLDLIQI